MIEVIISYYDLDNTENPEALILKRLREAGAEIGQGEVETYDNDNMMVKVVAWKPNK